MNENLNIFLKKKILIYGLGKSGLSAFKFLRKKNDVFLYDDFLTKKKSIFSSKILSLKKVFKSEFDQIILSPGININKCNLSKFLLKNKNKIYSDLDVFYSFYRNDCITITGTNGKSTTSKLIYEVLLANKFNVKLVGNIGIPVLSSKNIQKKTIFVIEASSYQLDYSKIFKSKYAIILNLSPDHIERHKTLNNYIKAKFKLLKNQSRDNYAFVKEGDKLIKKEINSNNFKGKITHVNLKKTNKFLKNIENNFFLSEANKENLSFVLALSENMKLKKKLLEKTIKKFKGLKYRQQIVFKKNNLTIINDSKSTSFSSSIGILKSKNNIYWLLGGIPKKGDKLNLSKYYNRKIKAFIYGKKLEFFNKEINGKMYLENFTSLKDAFLKVLKLTQKDKINPKTILFSPAAASFDNFKNFEDRGLYFNKLIKKYINGK